MTLIFEIAAGIVLGVVILFSAFFGFAWIASWNETTKLVASIIVVVLIVIAYNQIFPDKRVSSHTFKGPPKSTVQWTRDAQGNPVPVASQDLKNAPLETRAHFAARYKKDYPEYANTPDEELVKQVLHDYPAYCSKVEGGCP